MRLPADFSDSYAGETEVFTIDFVNDLPASATIASAHWEIITSDGVDTSPSVHLVGDAVINGTLVSQTISGLAPDVYYVLRALVTTNQGDQISLFSHVRSDA